MAATADRACGACADALRTAGLRAGARPDTGQGRRLGRPGLRPVQPGAARRAFAQAARQCRASGLCSPMADSPTARIHARCVPTPCRAALAPAGGSHLRAGQGPRLLARFRDDSRAGGGGWGGLRQAAHGCAAPESGQDALTEGKADCPTRRLPLRGRRCGHRPLLRAKQERPAGPGVRGWGLGVLTGGASAASRRISRGSGGAG